jgi:hypothetical protein
MALDLYSKYLQRKIHFEIRDLKKIYTKFLYADNEEKNEIIKSICKSLDGDRLSLARYLSILYNVTEKVGFLKLKLLAASQEAYLRRQVVLFR